MSTEGMKVSTLISASCPDIGQCLVVRDGVVLAVEAIEGTNAAIRRG